MSPGKPIRFALALIALAALTLVVGCADSGNQATTAAKGADSATESDITGAKITISPTSGPPGTKIAWIASGTPCRFEARKKLELLELGALGNAPAPQNYEEAKKADRQERKAVVSETSSTQPRGTISVPRDATPGDYWITLECRRPGGVVIFGNAAIDFEVTSG